MRHDQAEIRCACVGDRMAGYLDAGGARDLFS